MTKKKSSDANYEELQAELDKVMFDLQNESLGVDKALECYERGLELIEAMQEYLETAENKVQELQAKFNTKSK